MVARSAERLVDRASWAFARLFPVTASRDRSRIVKWMVVTRTSRIFSILILVAAFADSLALAESLPMAPRSYGRPVHVSRVSPHYQPPPGFNFRRWRWTFPGSSRIALPLAILVGTAALK